MNKILSIMAIVAAASVIAGCDDYSDRLMPEYASVVRLNSFGEQRVTVWSTDASESYDIKVLRSGHDTSGSTQIDLKVMTDDEWTAYANTYGLQRYYKLPVECFEFDAAPDRTSVSVEMAGEQISTTISLSLLSDKVGDYCKTLPPPAYDDEAFANVVCLPLILESDESLVYSEQKALLLIVDYKQPTLVLSPSGFVKEMSVSSHAAYERTYTLSLPGENKWGFTVNVKNDPALLEQYNADNGTTYTLMQPGALEINRDGVWADWKDQIFEFPIGTSSVTFKARINPAKVGLMDAMALNVTDPSIDLSLDAKDVSNIFAIAVKPSGVRLKVTATASDDDGVNTAANLIDGRNSSYFQSQMTPHDGDPVYGSYVDFKLPKSVQYFAFDYLSRVTGYKQESVPAEVDIYVSADGSTWTPCGRITGMQQDVVRGNQTVSYGNYDAGQPIGYIRWAVVRSGADGTDDLRGQNTTANWSATYINIYGK